MENIWRESEKGLPLHPQSREIATQDMMRGEVEVGDIQAKLPDLEEVLKKTSGKKLEVKNKLSIFAPRFWKNGGVEKKKSSLKDLHIQQVVQVLKKTNRQ